MLHKFHNKAISSSWAHFGHDSHTNQKEIFFFDIANPIGIWTLAHPPLDAGASGTAAIQPESTSLEIIAGWFFEVF